MNALEIFSTPGTSWTLYEENPLDGATFFKGKEKYWDGNTKLIVTDYS
jgi:hypothetical protein